MATPKPHLHTVANRDGAAILDVDHGQISTLNTIGAYIWMGLERGDTVEAIIANLAQETGETPQAIGCDVREFVAVLTERRLVSE